VGEHQTSSWSIPGSIFRLTLQQETGELISQSKEPVIKRSEDDGSAAWLMYGLIRGADGPERWKRSEKFARAYPNESAYRNSLAEEIEGCRECWNPLKLQTKEKEREEAIFPR